MTSIDVSNRVVEFSEFLMVVCCNFYVVVKQPISIIKLR